MKVTIAAFFIRLYSIIVCFISTVCLYSYPWLFINQDFVVHVYFITAGTEAQVKSTELLISGPGFNSYLAQFLLNERHVNIMVGFG